MKKSESPCSTEARTMLEETSRLLQEKQDSRLVRILDSCVSTNVECARWAAEGAPTGAVVVALEQTGGRGRRGRIWQSDGGGLYFSVLLRPQIPVERYPVLYLASALAVCMGIEEESGLRCAIKWPNDILLNGKKVSGMLTELHWNDDRPFVVLGIGINTRKCSFTGELLMRATSIEAEGAQIQSAQLLVRVLRHVDRELTLLETGQQEELRRQYARKSATLGETVRVSGEGECVQGRAIGMDDIGRLIVELESGKKVVFSAADVSVRSSDWT